MDGRTVSLLLFYIIPCSKADLHAFSIDLCTLLFLFLIHSHSNGHSFPPSMSAGSNLVIFMFQLNTFCNFHLVWLELLYTI